MRGAKAHWASLYQSRIDRYRMDIATLHYNTIHCTHIEFMHFNAANNKSRVDEGHIAASKSLELTSRMSAATL